MDTVKTKQYIGLDIWALPNGHLACDNCEGKPWCEHIETLVRENADAEILWQDEGEPYDALELEIPVFPTANLWGRVVLEKSQRISLAYRASFFIRPGITADGVFLGHIHGGEGRYVLRSMLLDYFQGAIDPRTLKCNAGVHTFKQEMKWQSDMKDPNTAIMQYWSVWVNKTCIGCAIDASDWADLIPDAKSVPNVF